MRLRRTLRGLVYSIRPSIARSVGLATVLDDLLTVDGIRAWNLGLQVLQNGPTNSSVLGSRFHDWVKTELVEEEVRWRTLHILAESLESRLTVDGSEMSWNSSTENVLAFADRIRRGEAVLTADVAERFTAITGTLASWHNSNFWQSLDQLVEELGGLVSFPVHELTSEKPSMVNSKFIEDLASWLSLDND
jgi:hypothetical protein